MQTLLRERIGQCSRRTLNRIRVDRVECSAPGIDARMPRRKAWFAMIAESIYGRVGVADFVNFLGKLRVVPLEEFRRDDIDLLDRSGDRPVGTGCHDQRNECENKASNRHSRHYKRVPRGATVQNRRTAGSMRSGVIEMVASAFRDTARSKRR